MIFRSRYTTYLLDYAESILSAVSVGAIEYVPQGFTASDPLSSVKPLLIRMVFTPKLVSIVTVADVRFSTLPRIMQSLSQIDRV